MSFKNLEDRFNGTVDKLYAGATSKFEGGKASNGRTDMPFIVRKPGSNQAGLKYENRALPVISTVNDIKRLTLFTLRPEGLMFLAKQQLLQTGNTFQQTRIINPAFVIANAVPFIHMKRNLRPLGGLLKKTDTSFDNVRKLGQLQVETYDKLTSKWNIPQYMKDLQAAERAAANSNSGPSKKKSFLSAIGNQLKKIGNDIKSRLAPLNPFQAPNIRDKGWGASRPELGDKGVVIETQKLLKIYQERIRESASEQDILANAYSNSTPTGTVKFIKYFTSPDGISSTANGESTDDSPTSVSVRNPFNRKRLSYIKDPLNDYKKLTNETTYEGNGLEPYRRLKTAKVVDNQKPISANSNDGSSDPLDPVVVSFAMGDGDHVQFRAFIRDIQQNARPEYKEYQYIGRIEKFISYGSVRRELTFKLDLVAFGPSSIAGVWDKINYLTGMVYPYGINMGILQPNIVRLTIGNLYVNQPGYVTSLGTTFNDPAPSWDIDKQIPIAASMNISFNIIEKRSVTAASPFYGITQADSIYTARGTAGQPIPSRDEGVTTRGTRINDNPITQGLSAAQNYFNGQPIFSGPTSRLNRKP